MEFDAFSVNKFDPVIDELRYGYALMDKLNEIHKFESKSETRKDKNSKLEFVAVNANNLKEENIDFREMDQKLRQVNEKLTAENQILRSQTDNLMKKLNESNKIYAFYENERDEYSRMTLEIEQLRLRIRTLKKDNSRRCDENAKILAENERLQNVNKRMKRDLDICGKKTSKVVKLIRCQRKKSKEILKLKEEKEKLRKAYDKVCNENENHMKIIGALNGHNNNIEKELETLQELLKTFADYEVIRNQNATTLSENTRLRQEIETLRKVLEMCREKSKLYDTVRGENAKIMSENDRLQNCLKIMRIESDKKENQANHQHDDKTKLSNEIAVLRQVNEEIIKDLERVRENHREVSKKYNDLKALNQQQMGSSTQISHSEQNRRHADR